jgi:hypothetical protein
VPLLVINADVATSKAILESSYSASIFTEEVSPQAIYRQTAAGLTGQEPHRRIGRISKTDDRLS